METVADLMTPNPLVVNPSTPLATCARVMVRLGLRHLLVVSETGGLMGVLSDFSVFSRGGLAGTHGELWIAFNDDDFDKTAGDVEISPVLTAKPDEPLMAALHRQMDQRQELLAVVDDAGVPVGVLTEHDAVRLAEIGVPSSATVASEATAKVITVDVNQPAWDAARTMRDADVRHLLVTEGGSLEGVISFRDLITAQIGPDSRLTVDDVLLRRPIVSVNPTTPLREAARLMAVHKVGCLPVLATDGGIRGVLTRSDLVGALVSELEDDALFPDG
ncbi:MAG: CBS domain-containing protein [Alphaproteobacteria bacterium]|nr:CBS domain-containing protein [Alphaproteobacteria bacterium]